MVASNIVIIPFWGTRGLGLWQLILSSFFVALGYPVASAITYALFSKVIHPVAQGDKMGYLTACGSLSRMVGPIWATALYMSSLPNVACLQPSNATIANLTHFNATFPPCTKQHIQVLVASPEFEYVFGVRGYPGAWMFVVLTFLVRKNEKKSFFSFFFLSFSKRCC